MNVDYPLAIPYWADPTNYRTTDSAGNPRINTPKGWVIHTPEEPADSYAYTPVFFADPNRDASTHYFAAYRRPLGAVSGIYQCVPESAMAIANGVIGKPYPKWADPTISLNWQSRSIELEGEAATIAETFLVGGDQFNDTVALIKERDEAEGHPFPLDREHIIGHYEVASNRSDPGQGFPWKALIAALNEKEETMQEAVWWKGRDMVAGPPAGQQWEIDLFKDFGGQAAAYDVRVVVEPTSDTGSVTFMHGNFANAGLVGSSVQAASFVLVPGRFGTAPFSVLGRLRIAHMYGRPLP